MQFKGLNGIRAIAAITVLISHVFIALPQFGFKNPLSSDNEVTGLWAAGLSVSMFFALSGFLITYWLLNEKQQHQTISIQQFYKRRFARIGPLYYVVLLGSLMLLYLFDSTMRHSTAAYYVFFASNIPFILGFAHPLVVHFWSLSVEEQFYLFWPILLEKVTYKFPQKLIFFIIVYIIATAAAKYFSIKTSIELPYIFLSVCRFHIMAIGALAAYFYIQKDVMFIKVMQHQILQMISWAYLLLILTTSFHIATLVDNVMIALVTVVLIYGQQRASPIINLECKLMYELGAISYGIYLYHPIIIYLFSMLFATTFIHPSWVFIAIALTTIIVSYFSFHYFEKRFLITK